MIWTTAELFPSMRAALSTILVCCIAYPAVIWALGQGLTPHTADGSLIYDKDGRTIGGERIAQAFTRPEYFWPRPSAADYNAAGAAGSNLSPANLRLRELAEQRIAAYTPASEETIPADLVTASGSGLDPHITREAALYQVPRVAKARGLDESELRAAVQQHANKTTGLLINVLLLNLELDAAVPE
ncbi:MAG: potassium-transporting ATPase subunit C [Candidatus Hydrogenedentes bacterium]|nr:potassium-transporting ATPase subunit C [Candidatus Hydrogenedentota bacterium]